MNDINQILELIHDCKYLVAFEKYEKFLGLFTVNTPSSEISTLLKLHDDKFKLMIERAKDITDTLAHDMNMHDVSDWTLGANYFGILTHYKKSNEKGDNSLIIKMEGVMDNLPLFEQCAVVHEVDLFKEWVPLCNASKTVEKISIADLVAYMNIGLPMMSRDMLLRAYGADCLASHGKIIIFGKSVDSHDGPDPCPLRPINWRHNRMVCKEFKFVVDVISPTAAKTSIITHIDPNSALPHALINFLMKNLAGVFLHIYQKQVAKVHSNPNCVHAQRIRSNQGFYSHWLLPKLRHFCDVKGWGQPIINSLNVDESSHEHVTTA